MDNERSDQTVLLGRLIWLLLFALNTSHLVLEVILIYLILLDISIFMKAFFLTFVYILFFYCDSL